MKKIIGILFFIFSAAILLIASNRFLVKKCEHLFANIYRYGDLYMLSNLPGFKIPLENCVFFPKQKSNVNLTILGDSYTQHISPQSFGVNKYAFIHLDDANIFIDSLDNSHKNILVIASTERYFLNRILFNNKVLKFGNRKNFQKKLDENEQPINVETNLQFMFTYADWAFKFKEIKAWCNLHLFQKTDASIYRSSAKNIYLQETMDSNLTTSSFYKISDEQIDSCVAKINRWSNYYRSIGFDEVIVSIIPNSVSINEPTLGRYNFLAQRINNAANKKFKVLDVYEEFKTQPNFQLYYKSDSHWNCEGRKIWLENLYRIVQ